MTKRGVKISILTNSLDASDVMPVHAGYSRYREALLEAGIPLYEYKGTAGEQRRKRRWFGSSSASLHAKTFVYDRRYTVIGTLNLDPPSLRLNTEIGILFESEVLASTLVGAFDSNVQRAAYRLELLEQELAWRDGETGLLYTREPEVGFFRRAGVLLISLLPIESQL